ncbi:hypothetical protein Tsubulata_033937 [Turnera subulata]|uniref:RING-type E3 ubiquitin transferase n=1 Tax=Turnera subulata TaxID=218843 RepID=A0A9Q0JHR0_9ROSI|nr:hypothetical protein Tsubulata_033937 [Turnera subulata]
MGATTTARLPESWAFVNWELLETDWMDVDEVPDWMDVDEVLDLMDVDELQVTVVVVNVVRVAYNVSFRRRIVVPQRRLAAEEKTLEKENRVSGHREIVNPATIPQLDGESCTICLEDLINNDHDDIARLPCSHYFHYGCAVKWLEDHPSCPLCRKKLPR